MNKFLYFCVNLLLIFCGAALCRRVFAVYGGLGASGYLGYLSWNVFKDSLVFPFVLTLIGLGVIWLGILWQRREAVIALKLRGFLPCRCVTWRTAAGEVMSEAREISRRCL